MHGYLHLATLSITQPEVGGGKAEWGLLVHHHLRLRYVCTEYVATIPPCEAKNAVRMIAFEIKAMIGDTLLFNPYMAKLGEVMCMCCVEMEEPL